MKSFTKMILILCYTVYFSYVSFMPQEKIKENKNYFLKVYFFFFLTIYLKIFSSFLLYHIQVNGRFLSLFQYIME